MKKATAVLMFILILATFALTPSLAAGNIVITRQPQNGTFPENSVASWSVEAAGDNLSYHWFIVYKGVTYDTNKSFAEVIRGRKVLSEAATARTIKVILSLSTVSGAPLMGRKSTVSSRTKPAA